jgi:hypothetical protein
LRSTGDLEPGEQIVAVSEGICDIISLEQVGRLFFNVRRLRELFDGLVIVFELTSCRLLCDCEEFETLYGAPDFYDLHKVCRDDGLRFKGVWQPGAQIDALRKGSCSIISVEQVGSLFNVRRHRESVYGFVIVVELASGRRLSD